MATLSDLKIKIFADGADLAGIRSMHAKSWISGFTTNPTLMRNAGIDDYKAFASEVLHEVPDRPVSFEVFADEFHEMEAQAMEIASWGSNVNVKIPVTNTKRQFTGPLIRRLSEAGVRLNVTAVITLDQVRAITDAPRRRHTSDRLGVCRADCGYRGRPGTDDASGVAYSANPAEGGTALGQPAKYSTSFRPTKSAVTLLPPEPIS